MRQKLVCCAGRDVGSKSLFARDNPAWAVPRTVLVSTHRTRGEAARNPQMTRGIFLARRAAGRDFRGREHPSRLEMRCAPADGSAESPARRRGRRSRAGSVQSTAMSRSIRIALVPVRIANFPVGGQSREVAL
jgi:hypothetical protein